MINYSTLIKFQDAGLQLDMAGQELKVGDYILCKGYASTQLNQIAQIIRVNKKSISIKVNKRYTKWGDYEPRPSNWNNATQGCWNSYPHRKYIDKWESITRRSYECLKVSPDFVAQSEARIEELTDQYPELFI